MSYTEDKSCDTAEEFVDYFRCHRWLKTTNEWIANFPGIGGFIFRGQADTKWQLIPSAFRNGNPLSEYAPQTPGPSQPTSTEPRVWLGWHLRAELRAVFLFLETADRLGIPTPLDYANVYEHSELIQAALNQQESESYDAPFPSARTLNQLALAQHHGVPTRLLDWSASPYIAAYFAAYETSLLEEDTKRVKSKRIGVFMLRTHEIHQDRDLQHSLMVVNAPRHANTFLRVQKGLFTHIPKANKYFLNHQKWPSLEDIIECTPKLQRSLTRISLPTSETHKLLRILYDMDITRHSLIPSLDNAAQACSYTLKLFRQSR